MESPWTDILLNNYKRRKLMYKQDDINVESIREAPPLVMRIPWVVVISVLLRRVAVSSATHRGHVV